MLESIKAAVAAANTGTSGIQQNVTHEHWVGQDKHTEPIFGPAVARTALVQEGAIPLRTRDGEVITAKAHIVFLEELEPAGAAGRSEPIDPRDRFTLRQGSPDALTGVVAQVHRVLVDRGSERPIASSVWLV